MSSERPTGPGNTDHRSELLQTATHDQTLVLSERDRSMFFDTLMHPPEVSPRLRRAFATARSRVET